MMVAASLALATATPAAAATITETFSYLGTTETFTVPAGVTSINVRLVGGQGGRGGGDSQGSPTPGGYRGVVSGTIAVTPGDTLTVAVGGGGGIGTSSQGNAPGGSGGQNPLSGYDGSKGGNAGPNGSSGGGGGSGAATVLQVNGVDVVAGGAGGNGGNGQFYAIVGRQAEPNHVARPDATSTIGRPGLNTALVCSPGFSCDGGASGAGGGGAQGGDQGDVQYGGASATEYFGFGGYPGANSTAGLAGLTTVYEFYAGNSAHGSMTISYNEGTPSKPLNLAGTAGTGEVDLDWDPPASEGNAPISDYVIEQATNLAGPWSTLADGTSTATATTVTGLTNGVTYFFRVSAVNSIGIGAVSDTTSLGVTPSDVPDAPVIDVIVPFDSGLHLDFTPGDSDAPVTGYEARVDGGAWVTATETANRITVSGLINGTSYDIEIRELNSIGASAASAPASGTPRAVPGAPSALAAVASNGTVALSWTAPAATNGSAITDYVIQHAASAGGTYTTVSDGTSTTTSATVTGLTNGETRYFRVAAVNAAGTGAYTTPLAETPFTIPSTPSVSPLTPGDGSLIVDFNISSDGGSDILRHDYRLDGGVWRSTGALTDSFTISGLTNGTTYDVEVRAINAAGAGTASAVQSGTPRTVPAAPAISAVALNTGAVSVAFTLGANGGSAVTNVEYSVDGGDTWITRSPAATASPLTISGLTGGQTYGVQLRAVNAAGSGPASNESTVTAKGTPAAPTISVAGSDRALTVSFSTPNNGGSPITNYEYSVNGGSSWSTRSPGSTASPLTVTGLTNGTSYSVQVRAVNGVGSGTSSATVVGTPLTTPSAPAIVGSTITGVDGTLDVDFTAPTDDGGSAITTYQYSTDAGATWRTRDAGSTGSPLQITTLSSDGTTPLTGGVTYPVEIRAVNAAGPGAASAVASGITTTVPDTPTITSATGGDGTATVSFTTPANGGSAITAYEYRLDSGSWVDTGSLSGNVVITGLSNSATYDISVRAVNSVGDGAASSPASVAVRTTPDAPTLSDVAPGDAILTATFAAPASDGGSAISAYQYSTDGGATWRTRTSGTTGSPLVITTESGSGAALTNGTVYTVQLRAVNSAGSGEASVSLLAAPLGTPSAPTSVVATGADGRLDVTYVAGSDGGSSITAIEYRLDGGSWVDAGSLSSPFTIAGLVNGTSHTVAVRATNAVGTGTPSATVSGTPRTTAGAPTGVGAIGGDAEATVSWTAPSDDGGSTITGHTARLYDAPTGGSVVGQCTTTATSCEATGLTNGVTLYVNVAATNGAGEGEASSPRVAVTPLAVPDAPSISLTPNSGELEVDVDLVDDGGSPVTTFEYRLDSGSWTSAATAADPFTISGLTNGRTYSVEVRAVNAVGTGAASTSVDATPAALPGAPTSLIATPAGGSLVLDWGAPASDGGTSITDYVIEVATNAAGPFSVFADGTSSATAATVTGLTNGTQYVVRVSAVNAIGTSAAAGPVSATPVDVPDAPTISGIVAGGGYLQVSFSQGSSDGGASVETIEYRLDGGSWVAAPTLSSPLTISGLTNGRTYGVELRALNEVGGSAPSASVSGKPAGIPAAVTGFVASPTSNSVTLSWDPVNDNGSAITAYNIIRWSAASEGSISASYTTTSTSRTVTGLSSGTTYYFTIEATNAIGTGPRSSPRLTTVVGGTVPAQPSITALTVTGDQAALNWTNGSAGSSAISGYQVQWSDDATNWTTVASGASAGTNASFTLPDPDSIFDVRVAAISAVGIGAFATASPPRTVAGDVTVLDDDAAFLSATANANGGSGTATFEVALDEADLGTVDDVEYVATPDPVTGDADVVATAAATGLDPATVYHVRPRLETGDGTMFGAVQTFTTHVALSTADLTKTYTSEPVGLVTVTDPTGIAVTRAYTGTGDTTYPTSSVPPTAVGTYDVTTSVNDALLEGSVTESLSIEAPTLQLFITADDRSFDGTTAADLVFDLRGIIDDDDVSVDPAVVTGVFDTAEVGLNKTATIIIDGEPLMGIDAGNYLVVPMVSEVQASVFRASQILQFATDAPESIDVGDRYTPVVTADSGLTVVLSIASGEGTVCSLVDGDVMILGYGTCVISAEQDGDANRLPADAVAQTIEIVDPAPDVTPGEKDVTPGDEDVTPGEKGGTDTPATDTGSDDTPATDPGSDDTDSDDTGSDDTGSDDTGPNSRRTGAEPVDGSGAGTAAGGPAWGDNSDSESDVASGGLDDEPVDDGTSLSDGDEVALGVERSATAAPVSEAGDATRFAGVWWLGALALAWFLFLLGWRRRRNDEEYVA